MPTRDYIAPYFESILSGKFNEINSGGIQAYYRSGKVLVTAISWQSNSRMARNYEKIY